MRSELTTANWQTGESSTVAVLLRLLWADAFSSLLTSPFDYSLAFDRALKEVIKTLPNRPSRETVDDVVCTV